MKTLDVKNATGRLSDYAKHIDRESVLVLRNGKPLAVLSSAKGMDAESIALANNPEFVAIIQHSRDRHEAEGGLTIEQVSERLGLGKKSKKNPRKKRA
jgi:hypothetical protein